MNGLWKVYFINGNSALVDGEIRTSNETVAFWKADRLLLVAPWSSVTHVHLSQGGEGE